MKKLKIVFVILFIVNIIAYNNVYAEGEQEKQEIKKMQDFDIYNNIVIIEGDEENTASRGQIFSSTDISTTQKVTHWEEEMPVNVLEYDEFLYQVIPLDYTKAKEVLKVIDEASKEMKNKKTYIEEQIVLSRKPNSNITVEQINSMIDTYNQECTDKIQETKSKLPTSNENDWKQLENRKMTYDDPTGNTAYVLVYAKVTYSKFRGEKTIYASKLATMNYNYLSQNQPQEEQKPEDEEEQKPKDEEEPQPTEQKKEQKEDNTIARGSLPKAGLKYGIITIINLIVIASIFFYKKHSNLKDIK